jgi:hypothetical protein
VRLKIFEHILYSSLRPWKQDSLNERDFSLFIRTSGFTTQKNSINEFKTALNSILPNEGFTKDDEFDLYELNNDADRINIVSPLIHIELPKPTNAKSRFYFYLITNEVTRLTDLLYQLYSGPASQSDKTYVINNVLAQIKHLTLEVAKEFKVGKYTLENIYILRIFRLSLIRFLLEVENLFSDIIKSPPTTDEELYFDFLDIDIPEEPIYTLTNTLSSITSSLEEKEKENINLPPSDKVSFNFNGDKARLLNVITQLNIQIELLNEDATTPQQMVDVLTARDLNQTLPKIQFNTETKQVRYVIDKLSPSFSNLTLSLIANCNLFYSKKGTLIKYSNLSSSKHHNPKNKETIDQIFRSL